jgi:hypothetical protein
MGIPSFAPLLTRETTMARDNSPISARRLLVPSLSAYCSSGRRASDLVPILVARLGFIFHGALLGWWERRPGKKIYLTSTIKLAVSFMVAP